VHLAHRHLVRAPVALGALAVDFLRARLALGRAKYDHRPARTLAGTLFLRVGFDASDLADDLVHGRRHQLVHGIRLMSLYEIRRVPIPAEQVVELLVADPGEHAGVRDLVAVEVEDG
jgi:hypothetical protein